METETNETLITLTSDIVTAHVSNNSVSLEDLPSLITNVYGALSGLGRSAPAVEEKLEPAVSIRTSVKPAAIACLECGQKLKMLKRHLSTDHNMTPAEYRSRWSLPPSYPMVAPDYSAQRAELAKSIGLGRKPGTKMKATGRAKKAAPAAKAKAGH